MRLVRMRPWHATICRSAAVPSGFRNGFKPSQ
jgi:hypothetical protein